MSENEQLTAEEAAHEMGYHVNHLYRLIRLGVVAGSRFSGVWMISRSEVNRVLALQDEYGRMHHGKTSTYPT